jgi:hypothetical protein
MSILQGSWGLLTLNMPEDDNIAIVCKPFQDSAFASLFSYIVWVMTGFPVRGATINWVTKA